VICCLVDGLVVSLRILSLHIVGLRIVVVRGYLQKSKTDRLKPVLLWFLPPAAPYAGFPAYWPDRSTLGQPA
jgi:hypothetical protein